MSPFKTAFVESGGSALATGSITAFVWLVLFSSFIVRTIYEDHSGLAVRNVSLVHENQVLRNTNSHLVDPQSGADEITKLKQQIANLTPAHTRILTRFYTMEETAQLNGKSGRVFVVLGVTNKPITPVDATLRCDQDITALNKPYLGKGGVYQMVGFERLDSKSLRLKIESPPWTPDAPLGVSLFTEGANIQCEITQENK